MAWITWRTGRRGRRTAYVHWRDAEGRHCARTTGVGAPRIAEVHRRRVEAEKEGGRAAPSVRSDPTAALDAWLAQPRAVRSESTACCYDDYLRPTVAAWAATPSGRPRSGSPGFPSG